MQWNWSEYSLTACHLLPGVLNAVADILIRSKASLDPSGTHLTAWNSSVCYCNWTQIQCNRTTGVLQSV
jgi:hypothetical protein